MRLLRILLVAGILLALGGALAALVVDLNRLEESQQSIPVERSSLSSEGEFVFMESCPPDVSWRQLASAAVPNEFALWFPVGLIPLLVCGIAWCEIPAGRFRSSKRIVFAGMMLGLASGMGPVAFRAWSDVSPAPFSTGTLWQEVERRLQPLVDAAPGDTELCLLVALPSLIAGLLIWNAAERAHRRQEVANLKRRKRADERRAAV